MLGCSQGGRIAIDFALAHPDLVHSIVLPAPALSGDDVEFAHPPEVLELENRIEACEEADDLDGLNALEAWAWLDGPAGPEGRVSGSARTIPQVTVQVIPDAAHLASLEQPQLFNRLLSAFLNLVHDRKSIE
ncbi:MAG: pimeloyl-ACP methyl ester carboxylesterase [Planctomycetota bacterium]